MFKVGKRYEFRMLEGGDEILFWGVVETYEHPLLKLEDFDPAELRIQFRPPAGPSTTQVIGNAEKVPGRIINITSPSFVSAVEKKKQ